MNPDPQALAAAAANDPDPEAAPAN